MFLTIAYIIFSFIITIIVLPIIFEKIKKEAEENPSNKDLQDYAELTNNIIMQIASFVMIFVLWPVILTIKIMCRIGILKIK